MVFLWTFGLLIEGKVGWLRFLLLYLGLSTAECALEQTLMLGYDGPSEGSAGASSVIYALMAIALIWAPRNDVSIFYLFCFWWFYFRTGVFEISVLVFSMFFIGLDLLLASLDGFQVSTHLLHLLGVFAGLPVGAAMVKLGRVDCEGWDAFSLLKQHSLVDETIGPEVLRRRPGEEDVEEAPIRRTPAKRRARQLRKAVETGNFLGAAAFYQELLTANRQNVVDESLLKKLIDGTRSDENWPLLILMLEDYIDRFPQSAASARLMLAGLLVKEHQRPRSTLRLLEDVDGQALSDSQRKYVASVRAAAESMIDRGVIELATDPTRNA